MAALAKGEAAAGRHEEEDGGHDRRRTRHSVLALGGSTLAVLLLVVARGARGGLESSGAVLAAEGGGRRGAENAQLGSRYGAEQVLTRLWDEDAVGAAMDAEIAAVKRQFKRQQLGARTAFFGLRTTALQAANATGNASDAANATAANATVSSGTGIAFDNTWFANWCVPGAVARRCPGRAHA